MTDGRSNSPMPIRVGSNHCLASSTQFVRPRGNKYKKRKKLQIYTLVDFVRRLYAVIYLLFISKASICQSLFYFFFLRAQHSSQVAFDMRRQRHWLLLFPVLHLVRELLFFIPFALFDRWKINYTRSVGGRNDGRDLRSGMRVAPRSRHSHANRTSCQIF